MVGGVAESGVMQNPITLARAGVIHGNRGTLRVLLGVTLALTALFGAVAGATVASRISATRQFAARAEPLAIDLQQLYTALDDADATAAAAYLSGGMIDTALRDKYDGDIARAESSLSAASREVAADDPASARLAAIASEIPVYTGLVATAQTDNRDATVPQPIGTAYLREASNLMRTSLLADAQAAYQAEVARLDTVKGTATGIPWLGVVSLAAALAALGVAQRQVARRTHRVLNPGLLTATGALVIAVVWTGTAVEIHRSHLDEAQHQAGRIRTLATAADAAIQADADEVLMLIAHGSDNGAYAQDFTAQSATALKAIDAAGTTTPRLADAAGRLRDWSVLDGKVRADAAADSYQNAVTIALGQGSADATGVADDLNGEMTGVQRSFADDANAAGSALDGLLVGEIALAAVAAGAAVIGLNRRLAEYR